MKKSMMILLSLLVLTSVFANVEKEKVSTTTMMGLSRTITTHVVNRDALLDESFEGTEMPADWTVLNIDGDTNEWEVYTYATAIDGAHVAKVGYNGEGNDDWLITPQLAVTGTEIFKLYVKSGSSTYLEDYNVLVSTTGNAPENFTLIEAITSAPNAWTEKQYSLADYSGNIYLAIQCVSVDEMSLYVDAVTVADPPTDPVIELNYNGINFDEQEVGVTVNPYGDVFTISNSAGGSLEITSTTDLTGTAFSTNFDDTVTIAAGESYAFGFDFTPSAVEAYDVAFEIVSTGGTVSVQLQGSGYVLAGNQVQVGAGLWTGTALPFDPYYNYGFTQSLFTAEEIAGSTNTIESIAFRYANVNAITANIEIYMAQTTEDTLATWNTDFSNLVYAGDIVTDGIGWVTLTLDTPFVLDGTDNLVITTDNNTGSCGVNDDEFYGSENANNMSIYRRVDSADVTIDVLPEINNTYSGAYNSIYRPNIRFNYLDTSLYGSIAGTVTLDVASDVTVATVTAAGITVNPAADGTYSIAIAAGTYDVTASLEGYTTVTTNAVVVEESTITDNIDFALVESTVMAQPVDASVDVVTGTMSWYPPTGEGSDGWASWCAEENNDGIGLNGGGTFSCASRWDTENVAQYNGMTLTKVSFFPSESVGRATFTVKVWAGADAATLVAEQEVTPVYNEWNEVELTNPVSIDGTQELWFGYTVADHADGAFPAGVDAGPAVVGFGDMISTNGTDWSPLSDSPDLDSNWNIKGYVQNAARRTIPMTFVENDFNNTPARNISDVARKGLNLATRNTREVESYNVYLDGTLVAEEITTLNYTFTTLEVGTEYLAGVAAVYADAVSEVLNVTFTYAGTLDVPTNVAADAISGVISWDVPGAGSGGGDAMLEEGFEAGIPATWTIIDNDDDGYNWAQSPSAAQVAPHTGEFCAVSASWEDSVILTPDNFLVTPQLTLDASSELTFWAAAQDPDYPSDYYCVKVSTTGNAAGDFTDMVFEETLADDVWHEITVDLSAYAGEQVYIAFEHCNSTDWFEMKMDDVSVTSAASRDFTGEYNVYKNGVLIATGITETTYTCEGLLVGSEYTIGITAIHDEGESDVAEVTFTFLGEDDILPIEDLAVDSTTGVLSWTEPGPAIDYSENFDGYTAGDYLAQVSPMWTTWTENPGGADDAMISTDQASSPSNSVHAAGDTDLILPMGNKTSGTYVFEMKVYIPTGFGGYYNIQHYQTPGIEWAAEFFFGNDGNGEYNAGFPTTQTFTHALDTWLTCTNVIDLDAQTGTFSIDGTEIANWNFSLAAQGEAGICQLGGVDIFSGGITGQTADFYFDDVHFYKQITRPLVSYNIYLDDALVGNTTDTTFSLQDLVNDTDYTAGVEAVYTDDESEVVTIDFTFDDGTSSDEDMVLINDLKGNYPNPFNPTTNINFSIADAGKVNLKVYNAKGQLVKTLVNSEMEADNHNVIWNGVDANGKSVASGVYFYRLQTKSFSSTKKMMLIK